MNSSTHFHIPLVAGLCLLICAATGAQAANTWDGGSGVDSNWNTAANWDNDVVPTFPVGLTFGGSTRLDPFNDLSSIQVNGFTFEAGAGAFTLSGSAITLGGDITNSGTNTQTINLDMAFVGSGTRTIALSDNAVTLGGVISGNGGFTTNSADNNGTITLSGSNTFSGGVTLNNNSGKTKTLNIGHASALGTGLLTLNAGGSGGNQIDNTSGGAMTIANNVSLGGGNAVVKFLLSSNNLTIDGTLSASANTPGKGSRNIQVDANTLTLAGDVYLASDSAGGGALQTIGAGNLTIEGVVSNYNGADGIAVGITQAGTGTLTLSNVANTYTGATTISNGGVLVVTKLANGGVASSIGASSSAAANLMVGGVTATVGVLRYIGSGDSTDRLFGFPSGFSNTTLKIESSGSGSLHFSNTGTFTNSGSGETLELGGTYTGGVNTMAVGLGGAAKLTKEGAGTWQLTNTNTYTGVTTVNAGILQLGNGTMGNDGTVASTSIVNNANLTYNRFGSTSYSGVISGTGSVTKLGGGTQTLTNTNTYTGVTTVNAGTLLVSGAGSINSSTGITVNGIGSKFSYTSSAGLDRNVTLATGGGFYHNGSTDYSGTLTWTKGTLGGTNWNGTLGGRTVGADQILSPGNSVGTATTTSQTWTGGGAFNFEVNKADGTAGLTAGGWDLLNLSSTLSISATSGSKFTINLISLGLDNLPGVTDSFVSSTDYKWLFADATGAITGFSADKFAINTSGFTNPFAGTLGVALGSDPGIGGDNSQLYLTYTIPEPNTALLLGFGLATLLLRRRRK